ncbi:protein NRT1/ PTR FAMILY 8.3-like protein isoform X1 [Cinnamomum micranthum f. kanehirae]|uniref:Protein NRT1/ PTR FAMILY 8.3-like protein isoform X1 n=1 Tax=Cinnamomum micranthum f. kanehirae TaxID=337451 RepID=A0A443PFY9_9MAGN|nr:protein NRT1/ PTR FAMILY 8.3-like protein isoform X1 [Cinnamomum micranthum f. kanehirae]
MIIVTLSAFIWSLKPSSYEGISCPSATEAKKLVFFSRLYLIAFGSGGLKSSLLPIGADKFEEGNPIEMENKESFFNWFYFFGNFGALLSSTFVIGIEEYINWALGFGIATLLMALAIGGFLFGTSIYRLHKPSGSPLNRLLHVLIESLKRMSLDVPIDSSELYEAWDKNSTCLGSRKLVHTDEFRLLDKAATISASDVKNGIEHYPWRLCTVTQVEELKIILRLVPIWLTSIIYFAAYSQMYTTFIEQGGMIDTRIGPFSVPPASLFAFEVLSVMILVLIYDTSVATIRKRFTDNKCGITEL